MDMGMSSSTGMNMAMSSGTNVASSAMAASTGMSGMDMSSMGGGGAHACKISMLWNWYTIDSCFLAASWHITSKGMFAGSCIGVVALVVLLEFIRRVQREYDRAIKPSQFTQGTVDQIEGNRSGSESNSDSSTGVGKGDIKSNIQIDASRTRSSSAALPSSAARPIRLLSQSLFGSRLAQSRGNTGRPTAIQQLIRAFIYTCQFALAYMVMLLAMYYNGYIIICILIGAFVGHFIWSWDLAAQASCSQGQEHSLGTCCG